MNKRITIAVTVSVLSLSLAGCQQSDQTASKQKQSTTVQKKDKTQSLQKKTTSNSSQKRPSTQKKGPDQSSPSKSNQTSDGSLQIVTNPTSTLVLVNKTHKLPNGYTPSNLVIPDIPFPYKGDYQKMHMRQIAATAISKMFKAAAQDGIMLYGQSGYRSYATQVGIFNYNVQTEGKAKASIVSAQPGTSEHQTGLAMDISSADIGYQLIQDFGKTKEGQWVSQHAHQYGFIVRYPNGKESITKYEYEPWHIRYVGVQAATYIYNHHLTLEQYIAQKG